MPPYSIARRISTVLSIILIAIMLNSCANFTAGHASKVEPVFDVYLTGRLQTVWQLNTSDTVAMLHCTETQTGNGQEVIDFGTAQPSRALGTLDQKQVKLVDPFIGNMAAFQLAGTVKRNGQIKGGGNCPGGRGGGGKPPAPDCGTHAMQPLQLELQTQNESLTGHTMAAFAPDPEYANCPNPIRAAYYQGSSTFTTSIPKSKIFDAREFAFTITGRDTNGVPYMFKGLSGSSVVDWTMTFCRTTSNLNYKDVEPAVWTELQKSPSFRDAISKAKLQSQEVDHKTASSGEMKIHYADTGRATPDSPFIISVNWNAIQDSNQLEAVLSHEVGHVSDAVNYGFTPFEAIPFTHSFEEYMALTWQRELTANQFALKVLHELRAADPGMAPCVTAVINSGMNPELTALEKGDVEGAKQLTERDYPPTDALKSSYDKELSSPGSPEVGAHVAQVDLPALVKAWYGNLLPKS